MLIATRVLKLRSGGKDTAFEVRVYSPKQAQGSWACRYEIDWPEGRHEMEAHGVDSVQALLIALQLIGVTLYASAHHRSGSLFFEEPGQGYGFPVPNNTRDMLIGEDKRSGV